MLTTARGAHESDLREALHHQSAAFTTIVDSSSWNRGLHGHDSLTRPGNRSREGLLSQHSEFTSVLSLDEQLDGQWPQSICMHYMTLLHRLESGCKLCMKDQASPYASHQRFGEEKRLSGSKTDPIVDLPALYGKEIYKARRNRHS